MSSIGRPLKQGPLKHIAGRLNVNVKPDIKAGAQYAAAAEGVSFCAYVEKALREMNTRYWRRVQNENTKPNIKERV